MPSVRKKGTGYEVRFYGADGKRHSKIVQARSKKEAMAMGMAWEVGHGRTTSKSRTFEQAAHRYMAKPNRAETTQANIRFRMTRYTLPGIGHLPLEAITAETIEGLYARLKSGGLGTGSIRNIHFDIQGTLKMAERYGWIDANPALLVDRERYERDEIIPPKPADIEALLSYVDGCDSLVASCVGIAVRLALTTAARRGEITALRWGHVDWQRQAIIIRSTKVKITGVVALSDTMMARLREHRERSLAWYPELSDRDPIILDSASLVPTPIPSGVLGSRFAYYRARAGVSFRFHDLRHFAASTFLSVMTPLEASKAVRHKSPRMTEGTYGHLIDEGLDHRPAQAIEARVQL